MASTNPRKRLRESDASVRVATHVEGMQEAFRVLEGANNRISRSAPQKHTDSR
jgi:hypothetical protein